MTEDHYLILQDLVNHENYGIRRQATGLMVIVSKDHRNLMLAGKLNPISLSNS